MSNAVLLKLSPLTKHQKEFLRAHILRQRAKKAQEAASEKPSDKPQDPEEEEGRGGRVSSPTSDDELKTHADRVKEQGDQLGEVKAQISTLQTKLEALKDEKHRLFQQLKTVLNEEDEKKKIKEQEQKQNEPILSGEISDHRMSGVKRPLPHSSGAGMPPSKQQQQQQQRGPLLPTPDSNQYSRQGTYFWHGSVPEQGSTNTPGPRHSHGSRVHMYSAPRPGLPEQRFGMTPPHHHEVLPQARSGPEPHMGSHTHTMPFGHSVLQDIPPGQTTGVSYQQFNPTPSPYGSMSNITSPGGTQTGPGSGVPYGQVTPQGFLPMQHHPHSYQPLGEPGQITLPQEMSGLYPHQDMQYMAQGGLVPSSQGMAEYSHLYNQIHDPRQHRLMGEGHVPCGSHLQAGRESRLKK